MEDFFDAGGLPALLKEIPELLHLAAPACCGRTMAERIAGARNENPDVIRPVSRALRKSGGVAVLRGNIAERGAIIKPAAATESLLNHRGRAVVFESLEDLEARINPLRCRSFRRTYWYSGIAALVAFQACLRWVRSQYLANSSRAVCATW